MRQLMKDYGKHILAVLGVLLMLTFALPSLFNNNRDTSSIPRGTLNGKTITQGQINVAARDIQVLNAFHLLLPLRALARISDNQVLAMPLDDRSEDTAHIHWYLLLTEAQKYGLYVSDGEIDQVIQEVGLSETDIRTNLDAMQLSDAEFRSALRDALLIHKLGNLAMAAVQVSVPEMEQTADGFLSHVQFNYALLPDTGALDKIPDPSPAQIQKQFDLYKNTEPLSALGPDAAAPTIDGHTYPFGYKYPNRVQLEWLKFDYAKVRAQFKPTRDDVEQAYKYYKDHPEEFTAAPASQPASQPATQSATQTASAPASQPATRTASTAPAIKPFDDVRDQLVEAQLKDRATKLLHRMVDRALAQAAEPWKTALTTAQGFREPVPAKDWTSYEKIADGIQTTREFNGYKPDYAHTDPNTWDARPQLQKIPGIGAATYRTTHDNLAFPDLALDVQELVDPSKSPITTRLSLQVGIEGPVLTDADGNLYVYRVTAADPAHEPKTLDEVRARVIDDLKHLALYQQHQQQAKDLAEKASHAKAADDLLTLAKAQGFTADTSPAISRMEASAAPTSLTKVPGLVDAVFDLTSKSPATQPASRPAAASAPATSPATAPSLPSVATTLNDDSHLAVYVLNLHQYQPVTSLLFSVYRGSLFMQSQIGAASRFLNEWAGLDAIAKRLNYIPREPFPTRKEST
ncbi:MAG TPA: hypothetical protein VHQ47_00235 [Phycisphaerae bacterium]|nr:hypothetical protein [Phycisphaerae bacterium]